MQQNIISLKALQVLPLSKSLTKQEIALLHYKSNQVDHPESTDKSPSANSQSLPFGGMQAERESNLQVVQIYQFLAVGSCSITFQKNHIY